ncbi:CCHC-type integrase [Gossypium australe]|uniref:CCHC-type integrase n=1 Tax=Gossypium australe TaxID=47621 RepID=A0A5B6VMK8_9ROSI|nr:CCHC-type integrase [Gossypium australe]
MFLSDASLFGLGWVLMQSRKVIAYDSRKLKPHEFGDIIYKVRNVTFSLIIKKDLNLRLCRWLELLKYYDLIIDTHPGKANIVTDALS